MGNTAFSTLSTCLAFDISDKEETKCYEALVSLGRYKKLYVKMMLLSYSSDYEVAYDGGGKKRIDITGGRLQDMLENYSKGYDERGELKHSDNVIFLNWDKRQKDDMTALMILSLFKGGIKDFIVHAFRESYPFLYVGTLSLHHGRTPKTKSPIKDKTNNEEAAYKENSHANRNTSPNDSAAANTDDENNNVSLKPAGRKEDAVQDLSSAHDSGIPDDEELVNFDLITKGFNI